MLQKQLKLASMSVVTLVMTLGSFLAVPLSTTFASSHREAPLISQDPIADGADLYAFVSTDRPDTVTLIATYNPLEEPVGGPNYFGFGDDVLYSIKVDNDGNAQPDIEYNFRFKTTHQTGDTFLYNVGPITSLTDPNFNVRQTYTLTKVEGGQETELAKDLPVPPVNVGAKSTPNYEALSNAAIKDIGNGIKVFAGQTDDPFFVDLNVFDLLTIRKLPGNAGGGVDGLAGYNVQTLALQVPIDQLTKTKNKPLSDADGAVIGVWTSSYRQTTRVLTTTAPYSQSSGNWVQVSELGSPLVNEVVIPLKAKDTWNYVTPAEHGQFANYVTNPELAKLFKALYNIQVPPQADFGKDGARDDLVAIFLTGIKGLTQPVNVVPSEQLRLNVGIKPASSPNALGVVAGDNAGYPNGRRLADDVTDISLKAVAGAAYPLFHPNFKPDPLAGQLGDGVDANDKPFRTSFPYVALAWDGTSSIPHGKAVVTPPANTNSSVTLPFPDVTTTDDYASIQYLKDKAIVAGYPDGTFAPDNQIMRYEFVKLALLAKYSNTDIVGSNCFKDVLNDQWYTRYACYAKTKGIVSGYADGTFGGERNITIEEAYKILGTMFFNPSSAASNPWYKKYVDLAVSSGFNVVGIKVGNYISRENMATMLAKILKASGK